MRTVLVPVDGSDSSDRAVEEVIAIVAQSGPMQIHLLNVQAPIFTEASLIYLPQDKLDTFYFDQGERGLSSAQKLLKGAGLPFTAHRGVGAIAETIIAKAHELGADSIVMGTHGRGKVSEVLLGSVCLRVVHLSDIPVTVVRRGLKPDFAGRIGIA
ncbi:MAG TPA: universal stress protein [Burkholderiales bacterium]|nr:universal stress protein [Burkholderiales bacterium]